MQSYPHLVVLEMELILGPSLSALQPGYSLVPYTWCSESFVGLMWSESDWSQIGFSATHPHKQAYAHMHTNTDMAQPVPL